MRLIEEFLRTYKGATLPLYSMVTTKLAKTPFFKHVGTVRIGEIIYDARTEIKSITIHAFTTMFYKSAGMHSLSSVDIETFKIEGDYIRLSDNMLIPNLTYTDLDGNGVVITGINKGLAHVEQFIDVEPKSEADKKRVAEFKHAYDTLKHKKEIFAELK